MFGIIIFIQASFIIKKQMTVPKYTGVFEIMFSVSYEEDHMW